MQLHEVGTLIEIPTPEAASMLIAEGWTLVAIIPGERHDQGQKAVGPIYVLGKRPELQPTNWKAMVGE
ncbi:hypothetical protein CFBP1590__5215 [Pseudomonas viridiflava]|uniref:Uncharacterized protein n=1 Tax=Pseudomonas viridiflava TaxID=33069 RepID=A0A1Y6JUL6_PSEVI|nr:hypothetical protein CFBP1590__5215 [Pseudomonas viridiflava]